MRFEQRGESVVTGITPTVKMTTLRAGFTKTVCLSNLGDTRGVKSGGVFEVRRHIAAR